MPSDFDQKWLAEAKEWGEKLEYRENVVNLLRDAMAASASAETVERAGEVMDDALKWLQDASSWKAKVFQRVDIVHQVKGAALDTSSVTPDSLLYRCYIQNNNLLQIFFRFTAEQRKSAPESHDR